MIERTRDGSVTKIIELITSFFETDFLSEGGTFYQVCSQISPERLKLLLEELYYNSGKNLKLRDKEDLLNIFNYKEFFIFFMEKLELNKLVGNNNQEVVKQIIELSSKLNKLNIGLMGDKTKSYILKELSGYKEIDIKAHYNSFNIEKVFKGNGKTHLLIKTKYGYYFLDKNTKKFEGEGGGSIKNKYQRNGNKIIVFSKVNSLKLTEDKKNKLIESYININNELDIDVFFDFVEFELDIKILNKNISFNANGKKPNITKEFLKYIILKGITYEDTVIYQVNKKNNLSKLGTFTTVSKPKKTPHLYKGSNAIQMDVTKKGKKYILLTNGEEHEEFEI